MRRGCGRNGLLANSNCSPDSLGLPVAHMKLSDMLDTFNQSRHRVEVNLVWRMPVKARMRPLRIVEVQIPAARASFREHSLTRISILALGMAPVYPQSLSFDPPGSVFSLREPCSSPQGAVFACRKNPKPGNSVFLAHSTNTSPALT